MLNRKWSLKFSLHKKEMCHYVWENYNLVEAREIVAKLKSKMKNNGLLPVSTWILEYGFVMFKETYEPQGYDLTALSVESKGKTDDIQY